FLAVLDYLSSRNPDIKVFAKIWFDEEEGRIGKKKGTRMIYYTNVGTIPEEGTYHVFSERGSPLGELSAKFVAYLSRSHIFVLGDGPAGSPRGVPRRQGEPERHLPLPVRASGERRAQPRLRVRHHGGPAHERPRERDGRQLHDHGSAAHRAQRPHETRDEQEPRGPPPTRDSQHGAVQAALPPLCDAVVHDSPQLQGTRGLDRPSAVAVPAG